MPDGGAEYIIQIDPDTLQSLEPKEDLRSYIPAQARDVRPSQIRVIIGKDKLPRILPSAKESPAPPQASSLKPQASPPVVYPFGKGLPSFMTNRGMQGSYLAPGPLRPDPASRPMAEQQAGFVEPAGGSKSETAAAPPPSAPPEPSKPWLPLMATVVLLGVSFTGNIYLGWIFWETRDRYLRLLDRSSRPSK